MIRILLTFITLLVTLNAWDTKQFAHLGPWVRYEPLFKELKNRGVKKAEIRRIFTSEKSKASDATTLRLISSVSNIPNLREREREATKRFLQATPVLVRHLKKYSDVYDRVEAKYGVNREIIGALLQKETALGAITKFSHDAFVVYNTILGKLNAPKNPTKREKLRTKRLIQEARENLASLIVYKSRRGIDVSTTDFPSSYAGAMGIPQFTSHALRDAVSADGTQADLTKMEDAILSVANLLKKRKKWPGELLDFAKLKTLGQMVELWDEFDDGTSNLVYNINLEGETVRNFSRNYKKRKDMRYLAPYIRSLMGYNYSSDYALGILQIAMAAHQATNPPEALELSDAR